MGLQPPKGVARKIQATMHSNLTQAFLRSLLTDETSSGASGVMKLNTSSGTTSIATAANSVPQGRDLDHRPIATRITSPTNHLTSRISHRHEDRSNDEKNRS
ncbi:hypothetical protein KEM48_009317 [Puccinia striiformis f. sp. tritici PST-130]|nr:hypothetical protein KEM48_009317 [Puccinia striiformis f. sp. tritici PST-130]